jgi:hypothetical protein
MCKANMALSKAQRRKPELISMQSISGSDTNVMKNFVTIIVCLASLSSFAQGSKTAATGLNWKASYSLNTPDGWTADSAILPNQGVEDLRLSAGWSNPKSSDYWTYCSLWVLNGDIKTDEETIESNLTAYFTSMQNKSIEAKKIPAKKMLPVKAWVTEMNNENGDLKTFYGAIAMLDFKQQTPISLHCLVHLRKCNGQNKTFIFYEFSPKSLDDKIWENLDKLWSEFGCSTNRPYSSN